MKNMTTSTGIEPKVSESTHATLSPLAGIEPTALRFLPEDLVLHFFWGGGVSIRAILHWHSVGSECVER